MNNRKNAGVAIAKQSSLERQLKTVIAKEDLTANKALIEVSARHLKLDYLDLAAALLFINDPQPKLSELTSSKFSVEKQKAHELLHAEMVRYRIEVGRIHKASVKLIKDILVEEAGVERNKIGYVDIFEHYTVLSLPPGMPVEILQTFKDVEINQQALDIKRLSGTGKKFQPDKHFRRGTRRHFLAANKKKVGQS
ncbi:ATP-dependent RNA helicase DeaD [Bathymodiolus japonicus methanotrophic gill symbiont]|uniref:DbpA RNA binding domain-containing protein n=1 Tax=Bathymodiolus japonicus methanotrophic gill symbiont TaxID=113269 RepID=UPI001B5650D7|nr:DbpA RNA binding domain-containing protein [Bathymodiolus japonicus methanotrophic gill symbiont]GFO72679.1 ATP-dependent RNA helicase DeaD [Bathymodiolus japonicus methanotrophic gill symbiont]